MSNFIDLTGQTFGRLTVIERAGKDKRGNVCWLCTCDCKKKKVILAKSLRSGATKSCGCWNKEANITHGMWGTPTYIAWGSMIQRCNNPKHKHYKHYGGRGINVCESWLKFENFFKDMAECPEKLTIERVNNNGGYDPENCCWETRTAQMRNRGLNKNNKTGIKGVSWDKYRRKYSASITVNYKTIYIGRFKTIGQAKEARKQAEVKYYK